MADITPIVSLNGELAMPEKVWMQGPPGPQGQQGEPGAAATVTVGTVTTGEPGTDAIVTNSGTESAAVLNFTIPRGATGAAGAPGPQGPKGDTGETGPAGAGIPDGGTVGQLLSKTESGTAWIDPPQSGVQPDWNQNDSTQPDYVKNRPFYTGNPVETVLVEEITVGIVEGSGGFQSTFEATAGETYKVYWDGTVYECTCVNLTDFLAIGNLSIIEAGSDTGEPFLACVINGQVIEINTADTSASHTFSISGFAQEVVKIDEKYLPDTIATKLEVEVAQNMANSNKEVLYSAFSSSFTFTFDKQTSGRDTFVFNGVNYYKISDFNPAPENVISFNGTAENGDKQSIITIGSNCAKYGFFIVVAATGDCSLPVTETVTKSFTAPSAGLYAVYVEGHTPNTAGTGQFTLMQMDGLTIKSSTANSTKRFRITVDDTGTLKATEVT